MRDPSYLHAESDAHAEPIDPIHRSRLAAIPFRRPDLRHLNWTHAVIGVPLAGISLLFVIFGVLVTHGGATSIPAIVDNGAQPFVTAGPTTAPLINIKPWDGQHRLTILVMGSDEDIGRGETLYGSQMDMIMLFSLDPATHTA